MPYPGFRKKPPPTNSLWKKELLASVAGTICLVRVACGGMSIGHKGLVHAAKALAMTMVDLYSDPQLAEDIRSEFDRRMENKNYEAILPEGPPPVSTAENK